MSAENKTVVRRYFEEVWNQRKLEVLDQIIAPQAVNHDPASPDFGKGPEAARKLVQMYLNAFPDSRFTILDMIAEGDRVVARWRAEGTHQGELAGIAPTGRRCIAEGTLTARISGGKMAETWDMWDALGLMRQIGAVPEPQRFTARV